MPAPKKTTKKAEPVAPAPSKEKAERTPNATSADGVYKYALARLHKLTVKNLEDEEVVKSLREALAQSGDWASTKEAFEAHRIDTDEALEFFFSNTTSKRTDKDAAAE